MKNYLKTKFAGNFFNWLSAILILIGFPYLTIKFLQLAFALKPLKIIIIAFISLLCGGVTFVGLVAIVKFFYERFSSKFVNPNRIKNKKLNN